MTLAIPLARVEAQEAPIPYGARVAAAIQAATAPDKAMEPKDFSPDEIVSFEHVILVDETATVFQPGMMPLVTPWGANIHPNANHLRPRGH